MKHRAIGQLFCIAMLATLPAVQVAAQPLEDGRDDPTGDVRPGPGMAPVDLPHIDIRRVAATLPAQGSLELALRVAAPLANSTIPAPDNVTLTYYFLIDRQPGSALGGEAGWDVGVGCTSNGTAPTQAACTVYGSDGQAAEPLWDGEVFTVRVFFRDAPEDRFDHLVVGASTNQNRAHGADGIDFSPNADFFAQVEEAGGDDEGQGTGGDRFLPLLLATAGAALLVWLLVRRRNRTGGKKRP